MSQPQLTPEQERAAYLMLVRSEELATELLALLESERPTPEIRSEWMELHRQMRELDLQLEPLGL